MLPLLRRPLAPWLVLLALTSACFTSTPPGAPDAGLVDAGGLDAGGTDAGGTDAGPTGDTEAQARVVAFCQQYLARACTRAQECTGSTVADVCHPAMQEARCQTLGVAAAAGRLELVESETSACLGELESACGALPVLSYAEPFNNDRICPQGLRGREPSGGSCYAWEECAAGTYCDARRPYRASECPGRCVPFTETHTGSGDIQCAPGQRFRSYGRTGTCLPALQEGQSNCLDTLFLQTYCGRGLYCQYDAAQVPIESICVRLLGPGAACTDTARCAEGLTCAGPAGAQTCQPVKPVGASCTEGSNECARDFGASCVQGRCALPHAGDACGRLESGERAGCFDSYCDAPPGNGFPPEGPGVCRAWTTGSQDGHSCGPSVRWTPASGQCLGACTPPR